ncbi:MAG TPA: hypothetical protein ENG51_21025 [Deltaproteobacteria bacterium]|nr:MAG: hypothetical protein DRG83_08700 [Deltaproteobacteria bacterium]RLB09486.1 MAG: hypothetical protein DRG59_02195 [Deltaproteobacteria bacterium]HDM78917.1 hypothetical protein [Deltaproteobacteria bacterium]HEC32155.1 hypothetical protein [Deltaproteobacteria bacterium]
MKKKITIIDRLAGMVLSCAFLVIGLLFLVVGITFLPVIGVLLAIPVMGLSLYFFRNAVRLYEVKEEVIEIAPVMEQPTPEVVVALKKVA